MNTTIPLTDKEFLRIGEAAQLLSMSETATYALIRAGILPTVRLGARRRVTRVDITRLAERLMAEREQERTSMRRLLRPNARRSA